MENLGLYGLVTPEYIVQVIKFLDSLPQQIQKAGIALDDLERTKIEINKRLYTAEKNLDVAEAVAILHPEVELKNESARKAYTLLKTQEEQKIIQKIQIDKMDCESEKLGFERDYNTLKTQFEATLRISHIIAALSIYLSEYKDAKTH